MADIVVVNPATEEVLAVIPAAGREEVRRAVDEAEEAFHKWSETPLRERGRVLLRAAQYIEQSAEELVRVLVSESGKPIRDARAELRRAVEIFRSSAEEAKHVLEGRIPRADAYEYPPGNEQRIVMEAREPIGVVAGALSYNNPASTFAHKIAPVIAAGNTAVVKPSTHTPLTALRMAELLRKAGSPRASSRWWSVAGRRSSTSFSRTPKSPAYPSRAAQRWASRWRPRRRGGARSS
jgi:succinyl-CoA reductase